MIWKDPDPYLWLTIRIQEAQTLTNLIEPEHWFQQQQNSEVFFTYSCSMEISLQCLIHFRNRSYRSGRLVTRWIIFVKVLKITSEGTFCTYMRKWIWKMKTSEDVLMKRSKLFYAATKLLTLLILKILLVPITPSSETWPYTGNFGHEQLSRWACLQSGKFKSRYGARNRFQEPSLELSCQAR